MSLSLLLYCYFYPTEHSFSFKRKAKSIIKLIISLLDEYVGTILTPPPTHTQSIHLVQQQQHVAFQIPGVVLTASIFLVFIDIGI